MMTNHIKIMSLNVNGLNSPIKRQKVMTKLKKEKAQIIFLQETHLSQSEHNKLKKYGYRNLYHSSFKGGCRRGVVILISNTTKFELEKECRDKEGRYVIVKGRVENELVTLVNIYAPPESDKSFFKCLFDDIIAETGGILVCGGDLNVIRDHKIDTTSLKKNKMHLTRFINISLEEMGMIDVWRNLHPLEKDFTHYSAVHKVHSRIDYFFMNVEDNHMIRECMIGGADVSDHNPLYLTINLNIRRRHTVWRLNLGIMNNDQTRKKVKTEIERYIEENNNGTVDPTIFWDAMKAVIRGKLIAETAHAKRAKVEAYKMHNEKLRELEQEYQNTNDSEISQQIKETKTKINDILLDEIEKKNKYFKLGYHEVGSKATKILAKRIRKQQAISNIYKIKDPLTGEIVSTPDGIENIFQRYYQDLYTQPASAEENEMIAFLAMLDLPSIGRTQNDKLTAEITLEEIKDAINTLKNNKSPGSDGYPAEWYRMFGEELSPLLLASFNWTLQNNKIPPSWAEAIITVIPKQGKDKEHCASYRPISILNVDYKIYTTIISKRLNSFIPEIIEEDQTGFIRGRQTHDNIRRTLHVVEQARKDKKSTVLVSIDAEKAFDCVNWKFLYKVLERFGFSNKSIQCIKTLYQQPTARIKVNGSLTDKIRLQRSTRQGCCLSPTLFALFIEPLAQAIRQEQEIKGVVVNDVEQKIGLFADDVITYLEHPNESLPALMKLLETFGHLSGYKINVAKTQILALNYSPPKEIQELFKLNWKLKGIEYLGVTITKGLSKLYESNYGKINQEIQKDIERWSTLTLDLSSRIQIIRMNVLPRLLYLFQSLPVEVPQSQFWGGKRPRIRLETLQLPKEEGGMGLPNLKAYFHAAQPRYVVGWCKPDYTAKWKELETQLGGYPVQSIIGDEDTYKVIKNQINPITMFTLKMGSI